MVPQCTGKERELVFGAAIRAESRALWRQWFSSPAASPASSSTTRNSTRIRHFNVLNGTVDLHTGRLLPHNPDDLCTQQCPVAYDPNARAPLWEACLATLAAGSRDPRVPPARGRSRSHGTPHRDAFDPPRRRRQREEQVLRRPQHVLGPYSVEPHKTLLVASRHEQHATVVASLFRVRLAVASETEATDRLNDAQVKNLTGGDRLRARRMREDEWSFLPSHTLATFSNHRPRVGGQDEGIWRRVRLVPWDVAVSEDERDEGLAESWPTKRPASCGVDRGRGAAVPHRGHLGARRGEGCHGRLPGQRGHRRPVHR